MMTGNTPRSEDLTLDELCDVLANERNALAVRVRSHRSNLMIELFRTGYDVGREEIFSRLHQGGILGQSGHLPQRSASYAASCKKEIDGERKYTHLSGKGDGLLIEAFCLRVTNVGTNNFVERQAMVRVLESFTVLFRLDRKLAPHCVFDSEERRVKVREGKRGHYCGGRGP